MNEDFPHEQTNFGFDYQEALPSWCQSESARFIWTMSQGGFYLYDGSFNKDKMTLVLAALNGVSKDEMKKFAKGDEFSKRLRWRAEDLLEEKEEPQGNGAVDKLIETFCSGDPYPAIDAREELRERFNAQSHQDQISIIRTFLESVDDVDREWCCKAMQAWWDDCLIPDVTRTWETYGETCCAGIVAKRLPLAYVMEHQEALENDNYAAVCWRLATTEDYEICEKELTRKEFLDIAVHNHWAISDDDADELLFGFILDILDDQCVYPPYNQGLGHGEFHDGIILYKKPKRFLEPSSYTDPSLLHIVDMQYYVDALGRLGKANTLKKLYDWNEQSKETLADYITNPNYHEEIVGVLSEGYATYLKYIWRCFMDMVPHTFPFRRYTFRKTHNKYHFAKQEQKEYYPGCPWKDESPLLNSETCQLGIKHR